MSLRNKGISRFEVNTLFIGDLNVNQREQIGNLIKILGQYVFLNREQLSYFSEKLYGEAIGLSYIKKAVNHNLISELQVVNGADNKTKFYFELKSGGLFFLESIEFKHRSLKIDAGSKEMKEILSINNFLMENNYLLNSKYPLRMTEPFFVNDNIVLYDRLDKPTIAELIRINLFDKDTKIDAIYQLFQFKKMNLKEVEFNNKAKPNIQSALN